MADLFDYLAWRGDLSFEQSDFNEIDAMILSRLSYVPFELAVMSIGKENVLLKMVLAELISIPDIKDKLMFKEDLQLINDLSESPRFGNTKIISYVNQTELKTETQFSAITLKITKKVCCVSFRGTDNTLVGWKEDFNLGVVCPVPGQKLAVEYITEIADKFDGTLILDGHSKGGNFAVYAASFCSPEIQKRIEAVYNYDGPGFGEKVLLSDGYKIMCRKINTFVPQSSIVGMMFGHKEKHHIIHSTQKGGFLQHDTYSWEVERNHFVYLEEVKKSSKFFDYTLTEWITNMDYPQREKFVDTVFLVISKTNAQTIQDLGDNWFHNAKSVLKSIKNLDDTTRGAVTKALFSLFKSAKSGAFRVIKNK